jgi:hypothetical protein
MSLPDPIALASPSISAYMSGHESMARRKKKGKGSFTDIFFFLH